MRNEGAGLQPESVLNRWLRETDAERSVQQLELLLVQHAEPLVRRIVGFKLASRSRAAQADVEDVCQNALCQLLGYLERAKKSGEFPEFKDFTAYAATTAYNACNAFFRARRPAWLSLSMKVRYLATHSPSFALWVTAEGTDVCGLASQKGQKKLADAASVARAAEALRGRVDASRAPIAGLVQQLLEGAGGPLVFESLVDAAAELCGLHEDRMQSLESASSGRSRSAPVLQDSEPPAEARLIHANYIRLVWREIAALPLEHRRALLLNLNDSAGGDIRLFELLGVASIREIAKVLEMGAVEFGGLWPDLPLDDNRLAGILGMSRQDVVNRRSTARKRLARRLREVQHEI